MFLVSGVQFGFQFLLKEGKIALDGGDGGAQFMSGHSNKVEFHSIQFFLFGDVVKSEHKARVMLMGRGFKPQRGNGDIGIENFLVFGDDFYSRLGSTGR